MGITEWDLAGFTDNESLLGNQVQSGKLKVPSDLALRKPPLIFTGNSRS